MVLVWFSYGFGRSRELLCKPQFPFHVPLYFLFFCDGFGLFSVGSHPKP